MIGTPERKAAIRGWEMGNGKHTIDGMEVEKTPKMVLVSVRTPGTTHIRAFPKPEEMGDFDDAAVELARDGPSDACPGAVGTVRIRHLPSRQIETQIMLPGPYARSDKPFAVIQWAQTHLKTRHKDTTVARRRRTLYNRYAAWRFHALVKASQMADENGETLVLDKRHWAMRELLTERKDGTPSDFRRQLDDVCKRRQLEPIENNHFIVFAPKDQ